MAKRLADAPKPGAPPKFTPEQICQIIALACEKPADCGRRSVNGVTVSWRTKSSGAALSSRSRRGTPGGCSKEADLKPHLIRYWLTPAADEPPEKRAEQIADVCSTYREAPARMAAGERTISTDEMTGVQALERAAPGLPLRPGKVERREFEYIRHGTLSFMINFDVVTGQVICPSVGPTRTEADFAAHIRGTVESDRNVSQWHFVSDNLNTHCSESLVRYVAEVSGIAGCQGEVRHPEIDGDAGSFSGRSIAQDRLPLHAQARVLVEPGGALAQYPRPQAPEARQLHLHRGSSNQSAGLHRLLQPRHGQAIQMDLSWKAVACLIRLSPASLTPASRTSRHD